MKEAAGNLSITFPKNEWEFTEKEKDVVESPDHLHSEKTWHLKKRKEIEVGNLYSRNKP